MKTYLTVFFAGAVLTSVAFAADSDPFREERFKAKTGRYTPTEEARLQAFNRKLSVRKEECTNQECCRHEHTASQKQVKAIPGETQFFNAWSRAKWGRNIRRVEDRPQVQLAQATPAGDSSAARCDRPK